MRVSISKTTIEKLTTHLRIILIGFSIFIATSGCGFLAWDNPELEYKENYKNEKLNIIIWTDSSC